MARIRKDVAKLGSGWNDELVWYAKAIRELSARPPAQRDGWRYLAAIHGFDRGGWIQRNVITAGDALPAASEQATMWNQCQHQGWYFLPWHRGYVAAFEAIVGATVASLGGPSDWGLPYWNYLDSSNPDARRMPDAFLAPTMPDGSANPLSAPPRGGTTVLGPQPWFPRDITLNAMGVNFFTTAPRGIGFGGGRTAFNQFGGQTGAMENDPHNIVHVLIGGLGNPPGFMSDPDFAGLDPIFWLHHCNVDRLWAAWLSRSGNTQENGADWSNGPFPRRFQMPDAGGNLAVFTPGQTLPGGPLAPTYDDLTAGTGAGALPAAVDEEDAMPATLSSEDPPEARLAGANSEAVTVAPQGAATTTVEIAPDGAGIASVEEERVLLNLENIQGAHPSGVLNIYISAGGGAVPASEPEHVESVALFGLAKASDPGGSHAGNGISVAVDITELANRLAQESGNALDRLEVRLEQPGEAPITVERVSIYKQPVA